MKINFYVFRHGQTDWNKERRVQGQTDIPLNELGKEQAKSLEKFFKMNPIEICYSSDLLRAHETAQIALSGFHCDIVKTKSLREAFFGDVEGMPREELLNTYKESFWDSNSQGEDAQNFSYPGGETRKEVRDRAVEFINKCIEEERYTNIGISTHGGTLRSLLHSFMPEGSDPLPIPNCVVYKLEYLDGVFSVSRILND